MTSSVLTKALGILMIVFTDAWYVLCDASTAPQPATQPATQFSSSDGPDIAPGKEALKEARQVFRQLIGDQLTDADKSRIEKLLAQLGGRYFEERDEAQKLLEKESIDILPLICKACNSDDPETTGRTKKVVEILLRRRYDIWSKLGWAITTRQSAKDATLVSDLIALLDDSELVVRQKAYRGLFRLTGQDFGYQADADPNKRTQTVQKTRDWWDKNKECFAIKAFYGPEEELTLDLGNKVMMTLVLIPAGKFMMGSPEKAEECPQREVTISKPFYMGIYEVTQEQYEQVMEKNRSTFKGPTNPVENVPWNDAVEFCKKLSQKTGKTVTLPTEAQWEYACRAGSKTRYCFGDDEDKLDDYAWYIKNSNNKTHPVGKKMPNTWGLYDMHGNVYEWCKDWWEDNSYAKAKNEDPQGPDSGAYRVMRCGAVDSGADMCRSAARGWITPEVGDHTSGFRVVVDLK